MLCRLNEVKASFIVCDISCKRIVQHLSVNLEKACVTVFKMYHVTKKIQVWMKLKMNIVYHMHLVKHIFLFWLLARWEG